MQFLIVRMVRIPITESGHDLPATHIPAENRVVEAATIADAVAWGMLGSVVDGGESKKLTQYKLLNVIPLEGCSQEDGLKINELAQGSGLTQEDRDRWEGE